MPHITIQTTVMGFRVRVSDRGDLLDTSLSITDFTKKLEQWEFDRSSNQWVFKNSFAHFDKHLGICFFPKFELDAFCEFLKVRGVTYTVEELEGEYGKQTPFLMLPHVAYKNDKQKGCVEFLTDPKNGHLRGVGLQTGAGKTVSYIWALQKLHRRSMTTMTSRLEQWVKEMSAYTTLEEDDMYVIQGVGSLTKLFNQIDKTIFPKVILASAQTIRRYLEYGPGYQHLPHPSEMCERLGIGIVGTDEYHEHFYTNYLIGIVLNPSLFIPITATFMATGQFTRDIFDKFIPKDVQFVGGEYDKFVNVTAYEYRGGGNQIKPWNYMRPKGYSQVKFETFLLSKKGKPVLDALLEDAIIPIIREHYINLAEDGEKFLFLCATQDLCNHLAAEFKRRFNSKTISVFYSGMPVHTLEKFDMILSTPGSAGTGRDIKNLRTCFAFECTSSEIRNLQFIGRLRGPPQMMNTPEFNYIAFSCIPQHVKYHNGRAMLYGPRAKSFKHRTLR